MNKEGPGNVYDKWNISMVSSLISDDESDPNIEEQAYLLRLEQT